MSSLATLKFSARPGRRERQLQRRHGNPLFGRPAPRCSREALDRARRLDLEEAQDFERRFLDLVQTAIALKPNEDSSVILELKERLDQSYEEACRLGGEQSRFKDALHQLVAVVMAAVRKSAGDDHRAQQELDQEEAARRTHFSLLEHPLVADLLDPQSVVAAEELVPTLLAEPPAAVPAAEYLYDAAQRDALCRSAARLVSDLQAAGVDTVRAEGNLNLLRESAAKDLP